MGGPLVAFILPNVQSSTVNREYFVVKYFQTAWLARKLNTRKYIRNINDNAVQGRLSENDLTRKIIT